MTALAAAVAVSVAPRLRSLAIAAALLCAAAAPLHAQPSPAATPEASASSPAVHTQGEFRSRSQEDGGRSTFAHIKIAPGWKIPFTTMRYRVRDARLLDGLKPGTRVEFRAERVDGENVLLAIRPQNALAR